MPAARATVGIITYFAPSPGPRQVPASAHSTSSAVNVRWPVACSSGIAPTTRALATSLAMLTRRVPTRSVTGPARAVDSAYGAVSAIATRPVRVAEPVVSSTNSGSATMLSRLPTSDTA
ncbi:hypothetical protein GCM10025868_16190 [Angustibacter aerolatus]|uniref:Uncharacterized protein n=1 Tax=Angustibacter aerolatus TaxID=1162965 RepID=A0ABQ6JEY8_9ACTN|nr:hypothetical protein GCM10025868_16190 [Angustibacter aerolatus]